MLDKPSRLEVEKRSLETMDSALSLGPASHRAREEVAQPRLRVALASSLAAGPWPLHGCALLKCRPRLQRGHKRLALKVSGPTTSAPSHRPRPPCPVPGPGCIFSCANFTKDTTHPLLIEQFRADRRKICGQAHHYPGAWAICLAPRSPARRMYFMARSEDKHTHLYVTCCNINANLYFFQNF